jgi:hypothetical protein
MRWLLLVLLAGCAKDVTKEVEDLADRACACADKKDTACGKTVLADVIKLSEEHNVKSTDERKAADSAKRLGECLERSGVTGVEISEAVNAAAKPKDEPKAESP